MDFKLKSKFMAMDSQREYLLQRAEKYAGWTLPTVFPDAELSDTEEMQNDYQSVGAQAVNSLANKIMMALFQPSRPFFRLDLNGRQREEVVSDAGLSLAQVDAALANIEREAMRDLNKINARVSMIDMILQLIITGNSLFFVPKDGKTLVYSLRDYVIKRNLRGEVLEIIIRETKEVSGLEDELKAIAMSHNLREEDTVSIYTGITKDGTKFRVTQELEDLCVCHKKEGIYNKDTLPWIPLTWKLARGHDYGTGLVEEYSGDFHSLSTTAEAILDYTTVVTDVKNLVNPAGQTDVRELTESPSGAYVHGREEDIFVHTANVSQSADFLENRFRSIERRIGAAFLLNSSVTRDAERVTAEEIRLQAQELESSLGGVYSRLAAELQLPLAIRLMRRQDSALADIEPTIVTGLESLSRNSDLDNFRMFMQDLILLADVPDEVRMRMKFGDVISVLGAGHGVEYEKFLKDEDQVKREQKAAAEEQARAAGMEAQAVNQAEGQQQQ